MSGSFQPDTALVLDMDLEWVCGTPFIIMRVRKHICKHTAIFLDFCLDFPDAAYTLIIPLVDSTIKFKIQLVDW